MYKLLALDIDGTLLTSNHNITARTVQAIEKARSNGVQVTLATGRNLPNTKRIVNKLDIELPIVTNDGAYIVNPRDRSAIFEKRLDRDLTYELVEKLGRHNLRYLLHYEDYNLTYRKMEWAGLLRGLDRRTLGFILYEFRTCKVVPRDQIVTYMERNGIVPFKMTVIGDAGFNGQLADIKEEFTEAYGQKIDLLFPDSEGFEILPKGMSKAKGLEILCARLNLRKTDVAAIGDSYNDAEMLSFAGLGIAMGNAPESVKSLAACVTKTNDENGVAYAIDEFICRR